MSRRITFGAFVACATSIACIATAADAASIVDWGGNYVSSNQTTSRTAFQTSGGPAALNYDTADTGSEGVYGVPLSEIAALNPASDYSGSSATFYGGYGLTKFNDGNGTNLVSGSSSSVRVVDNADNDTLLFNIRGSSAGARAGSGMALWRKADFLNGGSSATLSLDQSAGERIDSLAMNITTAGSGVAQLRILVASDGTYYVSEDLSGSGSVAAGLVSLDGADLAGLTFYSVDMMSGSARHNDMNSTNYLGAAVASNTLTDITAIGFTFNSGAPGADGNGSQGRTSLNADFAIDSFVVSSIPEPTTTALLLLGAGLAVTRRGKAS